MTETTKAKSLNRPILTSPIPERIAVTGNAEMDRTDSQAILARIRDHLPKHLAPIQTLSHTPDATKMNLLPGWKRTALTALPNFNSRPLDKIHTALNRVTHGKKRSLVEGPRVWDRASRRFIDAQLSDDERKGIAWLGKAARLALAERDDDRLARSVRVLMMLPTSGDQIQADHAETWLMLLSDYPIWAIEAACIQYGRTQKWRPSPAEIIQLANDQSRFVRELADNADTLARMEGQAA